MKIFNLKYHLKEEVEIFKYFTLEFSELSFQRSFLELKNEDLGSLFKQCYFSFQSIDLAGLDRSHASAYFALGLKVEKSVLIRSVWKCLSNPINVSLWVFLLKSTKILWMIGSTHPWNSWTRDQIKTCHLFSKFNLSWWYFYWCCRLNTSKLLIDLNISIIVNQHLSQNTFYPKFQN